MRKVVAYELLSLDGVAEEPRDYITDFDAAVQANLDRVIADQDAVLLRRRTWDDGPPSGPRATSSRSRVSSTASRSSW